MLLLAAKIGEARWAYKPASALARGSYWVFPAQPRPLPVRGLYGFPALQNCLFSQQVRPSLDSPAANLEGLKRGPLASVTVLAE